MSRHPDVGHLTGVVVHGDSRGRVLGFPTANLLLDAGELPDDGIYAALTLVRGLPYVFTSTVSVGTNPTFPGRRARRVEVHLHDLEIDLYGRRLDVELVEFIRPTLAFDDVERLCAQSREDVRISERILRAGEWPSFAGFDQNAHANAARSSLNNRRLCNQD
ncbi:riboflavin kinase [Agromyces neolithicus]|uniref:riboflavin kinase n=1 Tax=Agromyces neolithicus TaxID=269420 RepID=A0ABN2M1L5_9MICO